MNRYCISIDPPPPPPHTQYTVSPVFHLSQYDTREGGQQVIHLSAPILTRSQTPPFTGSIQVYITAEDLNAEFGKH